MPSAEGRPAIARAAPVDHSTSNVSRGSAKPGSTSSTCAPSAANANAACATRPAISGSTAYVGGTFSRVAPYTGGSVRLDKTTAQPRVPWPPVDGTVEAIAAAMLETEGEA